jgi:hypothetical protein
MDVQEMHYEVKLKLNKVDSQDYENLIVPEIDWYLNEAQNIFIKQRYGISNSKRKGFETSQKRIDDLRELVVKGTIIPFATSLADINTFEACLPINYMFYIRSRIDLNKGLIAPGVGDEPPSGCDTGFVIGYSDGTFTLTDLRLDYLRHPVRISWGGGIDNGGLSYTLPNGVTAALLTNCELAEHTHHEIVDLAVMIASGDLDHPNFQMKMLKTQLNE